MIEFQGLANRPFRERRDTFIELCRTAIIETRHLTKASL